MYRFFFLFFGSFIGCTALRAQVSDGFKWWSPASDNFSIEGQGWPDEVMHPYDRLPTRAEKSVREVVWSKSQQSAGLLVRFRTNASDIQVRYHVQDKIAFLHMPATGVSGVDLFAEDKGGVWRWDGATYSFGDTVKYDFDRLPPDSNRTYYLYFPLYNKVTWLQIGVPKGTVFKPVARRKLKPVVVYGTSIAQGGVASRPGMAWTAILGRKLKRPVINLGFSSNGLLEKPVLDLMTEIDARIYVLDCLPNLADYPPDAVSNKIIQAVELLNKKRPGIPVLLVEDADAHVGVMDTLLRASFNRVNSTARTAFLALKERGIGNLYYLASDQIGLDIGSTVDGLHPNDRGMEQYAKAYASCIKEIFAGKRRGGYDPAQIRKHDSLVCSEWKGFQRVDFTIDGRHCIVVNPPKNLPGNPWIWRTEFFGAFAQADSMLVSHGYHVAYIDITDMYGAPIAVHYMNELYSYLVNKKGFSSRVVLEGFSRGGLSALNWAISFPKQVGCIYLDAPVCNFMTWPGGQGRDSYSAADWKKLKKAYGFENDEQALSYGTPLDHLGRLADNRIAIISVCGAKDTLVPIKANTDILEDRYKKMGGTVKVIVKPDVYHHPHSLKDPTPIVRFILRNDKANRQVHTQETGRI